ncbi:MAG: glycosyltransferase family 2 protein [Tepidiformaceae bacterium]
MPDHPLASLPPLPPQPLVSVVIPSLNEERYIGACLQSLEEQTYPLSRIEVLVADAFSTDRTREIVELHALDSALGTLTLVDNPGRTTANGLNAGAALAKGEVIVILGAHSAVDHDFIAENVRALRDTGAAATGGPIRTEGETPVASAIAAALSHPFGVGDARFRFSEEPGDVDTIAFAAYRRECFDLLGGFDTTRDKGEDDHFNYMIRRAGGRLYLTPRVRSTYYARSGYRALARQYFGYGRAKGRALIDETPSIRPRHLVPAGAVAAGGLLTLLSLAATPARAILVLGGLAYAGLGAYSAYRSTSRRGETLLAPAAAIAFPIVHASYGLGTFRGIYDALRR